MGDTTHISIDIAFTSVPSLAQQFMVAHVSHLYGLYPSNQFVGDDTRKEACRKVLLSRGDGGTGWALAWKINLWARLGDGEHALQLLKHQLRLVPAKEDGHDVGGGSYPNLLCAHPPFQIDGNFGAASGIMEMLVQCDENGKVALLPALPKIWDSGCVKRMRLPDNRSVSFAWKNEKIIWSRINDEAMHDQRGYFGKENKQITNQY